MKLAEGTKLGRYEIRPLIGVGGMGEVYRANDPKIGRDVAIKVRAMVFTYAGRFDEAILQAQKTVELDANFSHGHTMLGYALSGKGRHAEAIAEYEKSISLHDDGYSRSLLVRALVLAGRRTDAERQLEAMRTLAAKQYVPDFCFAIAHTALGDKETAIKLLEKEVEERSSFAATINVEIALNDLRDHPRFRELLKKGRDPLQ